MVTYKIDVLPNRFAIAEEVISSAGNVLVAAGFEPDEIASIFQQAAEQLTTGEAITLADETSDETAPSKNAIDLDDIRAELDQLAPVKALEKLNRRAEALDRPHDDLKALLKCFDLATKMLPHIASAQHWIRETAKLNGIDIIEDRNRWTIEASDDDLDRADDIIFICEFEWSYPLCLEFIDSVVTELVEQGDKERFFELTSAVDKLVISMPNLYNEMVEEGRDIIGKKDEFWQHVLSQPTEVQETQFLENFIKSTGFPRPSHFLMGWLQQMEESGLVERYKSANRWRLRVL